MKKVIYYLLLTGFIAMMSPYYIVALVAEYYSRFMIFLFTKPSCFVRGYGTLPKWLSSIIGCIENRLNDEKESSNTNHLQAMF